MKVARTATAIFMITTFAVIVPRLVWAALDTYVLGHPDSKFGASGGIFIVAALVCIAGLIAGIVACIVALARTNLTYRFQILSALIAGLALSFVSFWIPDLGIGYSLIGEPAAIIFNWAIVCVAAVLLVQLAIASVLPPNSAFNGRRVEDNARR